jgi:hypothetical protein
MKRSFGAVVLSSIGLIVLALPPIAAQRPIDFGQVQLSSSRFIRMGDRAIPNHYIVVLDRDVETGPAARTAAARAATAARNAADVATLLPEFAGTVTGRFDTAVNGFSAFMTEAQAIALSQDSRVRFVEEDSIMEADATQTGATWGLDRIDQRALPLNQTYTYTQTGSGVTAYVIDTGIRISHTQFAGRASVGFDAIGDGRNGIDCNGHGTHVSGTIGGSTFGVADWFPGRGRVLSCSGSGSNSGVIMRRELRDQHLAGQAVANMSLGGGASTALDTLSVTRSPTAVYDCRRQFERTRNSSGARLAGDYGRRIDDDRCAFVVLELAASSHLRAGIEHHVGVDDERHGDQHDQRHVDGDAARRRRRSARAATPWSDYAGGGPQRAGEHRDPQSLDRRPVRHGQPAAVPFGHPVARTLLVVGRWSLVVGRSSLPTTTND